MLLDNNYKNKQNDGIEIVFIPDYVYKMLNYKNIELSIKDLNHAYDFLKDDINKQDIKDFLVCNRLLHENLTNCLNSVYLENITYNKQDEQDIINLFSNSDITNINMSTDNNRDKGIWSLVPKDDFVFIVIHSGFTNYILHNNLVNFKRLFFKELIDYVYRYYGESKLVNSYFFNVLFKLKQG
jgi:hypothetical protein